jgi:hypothetical protein
MRRLFLACVTWLCSSLVWADHGIGTYYLLGKAYFDGKVLANDSLQVRYFGMESFPTVPDSSFVPVDASGQFSVPFYFPAHCSIINRPNLDQVNPSLFFLFMDLYETVFPEIYIEICFKGDCQKFENEAVQYYRLRWKEVELRFE